MKLGKFEFKIRHKRAWLLMGCAVLAIGALYIIWVTFFVQSINPKSRPPAQPPVIQQELHPTSFQQTRRLFGPWELLVGSGNTGAPRLVMLRADGGTDASSAVVRANKEWEKASAIEILSVVPSKQIVRIRTAESRIYTLQYSQAFILSQRPDTVYSFLRNGPDKAQLVSTTVQTLIKR